MMSRVGVRCLITTRLRYLLANSTARATSLITSKYNGCVYIKDDAYSEYHDDKSVVVTKNHMLISFTEYYLTYGTNSIRVYYPDIQYDWCDTGVFTIIKNHPVVRLAFEDGYWANDVLQFRLSEPGNMWKCMQELIAWYNGLAI